LSEKLRVVFMGTPAFAVPSLEALLGAHEIALVVSRPDEPQGRGMRLASPPVVTRASAAGVAVLQPEKIRNAEFYERLRAAAPDVIVVVAYGKILPKEILALPRLGCVNVHASLLPKYRGAAPIQWAIARGERETGVTIMKMDEGMDTGPMLLTRALPISDDDTGETLAKKLAPLGAEALLAALPRYAAGELLPTPQPAEGATMAPILKKEDGRIDWGQTARSVSCLVRGMMPWPVAQTRLPGGAPLRVLMAREVEGKGAPGEILRADPKGGELGFVVAAGEGAVALASVQVEGRKPLPGGTFVMGTRPEIGQKLGG
jgi:methionyl-tRNA formyltransferase